MEFRVHAVVPSTTRSTCSTGTHPRRQKWETPRPPVVSSLPTPVGGRGASFGPCDSGTCRRWDYASNGTISSDSGCGGRGDALLIVRGPASHLAGSKRHERREKQREMPSGSNVQYLDNTFGNDEAGARGAFVDLDQI
jgi:hypothetical protein